jgi:hypothetical protein
MTPVTNDMRRTPPIQGSLDLKAPRPIDSWLPDETLFSLASRHHILSCNRLDAHTCLQLFGHRSIGARHDVPSRIDILVERTRGNLGGALEMIFERTLVPFYFPLKSRKQMEEAVSAMRGNGIGSLRYSLGMLANRFQAHHPLKACELCMKDDVERFEVAYWHRVHQIPGVWLCPQHDRTMQVMSIQGARDRFGWCLPRLRFLMPPGSSPSARCEQERLALLRKFAFASIAFTTLAPDTYLDLARMYRVYRHRLVSTGMRETTGKLHLDHCIDSVLRAAAPLRTIVELSALPASRDEARAFVSRLCWERVQSMHPLLHLFTIIWLFEGWDEFRAAYDRQALVKPVSANVLAEPLEDVEYNQKTYRILLADLKAGDTQVVRSKR